jgi:Glutaredoxin-like domain (DUF836)
VGYFEDRTEAARRRAESPLSERLASDARAYCHLCDEMLAAVRPLAAARGATIAVVDVDAHPALERAYGDRVPVLFAGDPATGNELCHFRLDRRRVEAALGPSAAPPA